MKSKLYKWLEELKYRIIRKLGLRTLYICYEFDKLVRKTKLDNEQFFLDWQDELNEISVK